MSDDQEFMDSQIRRIIDLQIKRRWYFVIFLWLSVGVTAIWWLRSDIVLWLEFFTWSAVRVSIKHEPYAYFGLGFCVAMTLSTLIRQSCYILWGVSKQEYQTLIKQLKP